MVFPALPPPPREAHLCPPPPSSPRPDVLADRCKFPAIGWVWDMQLGQVIRKIREGGEHSRLHQGKFRIESDDDWYKPICDRPSGWDNIQHNKNPHCSREEWGGDNELGGGGVNGAWRRLRWRWRWRWRRGMLGSPLLAQRT